MNYTYTTKILSNKIFELQQEKKKIETAMEEPELMADIIFGEEDIFNFKEQIHELQTAIVILNGLKKNKYGKKSKSKKK